MGRTYKHLTPEQRLKIKELLDAGCKKTEIARALNVHNATIYREIERGNENGIYNPNYSEERYRQQLFRKGAQPLLSINPELAEYIAKLILEEKLSPAQIICKLSEKKGFDVVPKSRNTIYSAIDAGLIPGVTRENLNTDVTTVFNDGTIHISKWVRSLMDINDGDELHFEVIGDKLIFSKNIE